MSKQTPVRAFAVGTALGLLAGLGAVFLDRKMGASKDNATSPRTAASGPQQFPAATWRHIAVRTWKSFNDDQIAAVGAGVTFFGLLAMFPALGAFVALTASLRMFTPRKSRFPLCKDCFLAELSL
jgi:hypothetical protein